MPKHKAIFFLTIVCILPWIANAGTILSSMGMGAPAFSPSVRSIGMGGLSIAYAHPMNLSRTNPAAIAMIDRSMISAQYLYENNQYKDNDGSALSQFSNFEGFNFAIPLGSGFGFGFGLSPVTRVDYHLAFDQELADSPYTKAIEATGGLSSFDFTLYGSIGRFLSLGFTGRYIFGQHREIWSVTYEDSDFEPTMDKFSTQNGGFGFTAGLLVKPFSRLSIGATISPVSNIDMEVETTNSYDEEADPELHESHFKLPTSWGVGLTYQFEGFGAIGAEYEYRDWTSMTIGDNPAEGLNTSGRLGIGCEIQTTTNPLASYFSRMAYRFGLSYQPYFTTDPEGQSIQELWFSIGLGIPLFMNAANIDMAFSYGMRGSLETNGIAENLFRVNLSVTVTEKWFLRRY